MAFGAVSVAGGWPPHSEWLQAARGSSCVAGSCTGKDQHADRAALGLIKLTDLSGLQMPIMV